MKKEVTFVTDRYEMKTPLGNKIYYQVVDINGLALLLYDVNNHYKVYESYFLEVTEMLNDGENRVYMLGKNQLGGLENE